MKRIKKIVCLLLILSVILTFTVQDEAEASGLAAGLAITGSVVLTGTVLTSLAIIAANGAGMSEALRQAAQADGKSVRQYTSGKLTEYRRQNGMSLQSVLTTMLEMGYSPTGALKMGYNVANWWTGFLNWLWSENGGNLIDFGTASNDYPDTITLNGYEFSKMNLTDVVISGGSTVIMSDTISTYHFTLNHNNTYNYYRFGKTLASEKPVYACYYGTSPNYYICILSQANINGSWYTSSSTSGTWGQYGSSNYTLTRNNTTGAYYGAIPFGNNSTGSTYELNSDLPHASSRPTGFSAYDFYDALVAEGYNEDPDVYYLPPDTNIPTVPPQWKVLDTGGSVRIEDQGVEQTDIEGNILLDDYIRGLSDSIATDAPVSIPIEMANDVVVPYDIAIPGTAAIPVTQVAEGENASIDNAEDIGEETNIDQLEPYMLDLTSFFPFCIPFDIYNMLSLFRATRQAPSFDWRFYVPRVVDYTLTIDLSAFDTVASVLRTLELIAFCVALAFATKHIIQGGD